MNSLLLIITEPSIPPLLEEAPGDNITPACDTYVDSRLSNHDLASASDENLLAGSFVTAMRSTMVLESKVPSSLIDLDVGIFSALFLSFCVTIECSTAVTFSKGTLAIDTPV